MFAIQFTDEPAFLWDGHGSPHRSGVTVLGDYRESFEAPLDFWREEDYERQWAEGVERLVAGAETSVLVTRMETPTKLQILQFWALYRLDETVAVHEHLRVVGEVHRLPLAPSEIYAAVAAYEPTYTNEDGEVRRVSEWRLGLSEFADYLRTRA